MPFLWLPVPTSAEGLSDRGLLERNLIALLSTANESGEKASPAWLGGHSIARPIRESSLWNVNHVLDDFDPHSLELLEKYVTHSKA